MMIGDQERRRSFSRGFGPREVQRDGWADPDLPTSCQLSQTHLTTEVSPVRESSTHKIGLQRYNTTGHYRALHKSPSFRSLRSEARRWRGRTQSVDHGFAHHDNLPWSTRYQGSAKPLVASEESVDGERCTADAPADMLSPLEGLRHVRPDIHQPAYEISPLRRKLSRSALSIVRQAIRYEGPFAGKLELDHGGKRQSVASHKAVIEDSEDSDHDSSPESHVKKYSQHVVNGFAGCPSWSSDAVSRAEMYQELVNQRGPLRVVNGNLSRQSSKQTGGEELETFEEANEPSMGRYSSDTESIFLVDSLEPSRFRPIQIVHHRPIEEEGEMASEPPISRHSSDSASVYSVHSLESFTLMSIPFVRRAERVHSARTPDISSASQIVGSSHQQTRSAVSPLRAPTKKAKVRHKNLLRIFYGKNADLKTPSKLRRFLRILRERLFS